MPSAHAIDQSECNDDVLKFFVWITSLFRSPCQPICQTPSREHLDARTWRDLQRPNIRHFQTWNLKVCKPSRMLPTFCSTWCLERKIWQIHENSWPGFPCFKVLCGEAVFRSFRFLETLWTPGANTQTQRDQQWYLGPVRWKFLVSESHYQKQTQNASRTVTWNKYSTSNLRTDLCYL